jgi:hypothetical protein
MYYPEPVRAGSHGTSGVGFVIVLNVCYMSLITCGSADVDAMGARLVLHGPRGVIRITREVIDKAGLEPAVSPSPITVPLFHPIIFPHTLPCLVLPTPIPSPSSLSAMVLGSLPWPRRRSTSNGLLRRGVLGPPHTQLLWTSTRGPNVVLLMVTHLRTFNWQTLLRPTKGGCHAGYPFGVI